MRHYYEVKRQLGNGVSVHHYYYNYPVLNGTVPPYREMSIINVNNKRAAFWKEQGDWMGAFI